MNRFCPVCLAGILIAGISLQAHAAQLASVFGEHMVLQESAPLPIWGTGEPGEEVTVSFAGQNVSTKADATGKWAVTLKPVKAGGPFPFTVDGREKIQFNDVLVGEVWIASGQSNMRLPVQELEPEAKAACIAAATDSQIRFMEPNRMPSEKPLTALVKPEWQICSPETIRPFSALAYFFARDLRKELKVPVGIIDNSIGGTGAETWISHEALVAEPALAALNTRWNEAKAAYPEAKAKYEQDLATYNAQKDQATPDPSATPLPAPHPAAINAIELNYIPYACSGNFNSMVNPLIPYAIRGVIWYQGEANVDYCDEYEALMNTLISDWRKRWNQGPFPFLYVQIAYFGESFKVALLRNAQTSTLKVPNTGMAVSMDISEMDFHPKNKEPIGTRLAKIALAKVYGKNIESEGPQFETLAIKGSNAIVRFSHARGLSAKGGNVTGFEIASEDKVFKPAQGVISGSTITLTNPEVPNPVAVRYAWVSFIHANLYNGADLPAVPFRTDHW